MADVDMDTGSSTHTVANMAAVEGWIIIVTNLNEETTEEDLEDHFADFGNVKNLSMALNRRTGYVMGYALIEYATKEEAEAAIKATNGTEFLEKKINTDFAFAKPPAGAGGGRRDRAPGRRGGGRDRSVSPGRR
ncbi:hypothetical protein A1Q1_05956 [Trichosporon asahii var. asahii CBS 2479]|uniref:RRM domain-containing protein n=1 Tax=Trichosporon asahii var. asahii (strain ATCC 90039 / CBS 2479 / JCM 2466 / KCTC 7840 / NBRC 103889/ NCYC 2677 / UAMH 7654) TaxID=1186058 RepID=J4U632_TRIAS|nr:hypothetical protein A1Q1_05956 [Trichosporon asahii var. asahii CBS 2479]EJT45510.1 hypothetical protein A1Q1_05956 [Trichosporon asahii var. asahii CBS 2479]